MTAPHETVTEGAAGKPIFEVAVPYWPARTAMFWWEHFDVDEIALDFDAAEAAQLPTLELDLVWENFQPDPSGVSVPTMRKLERVLDLPADRRVRTRITLFPVRIARLLWLPGWALEPGTQGHSSVLAGHHLTRMAPRNLFENPRIVMAQQRLIREVVGGFADHPAVSAWILGRDLTSASSPDSEMQFQQWMGLMAETARSAGATQPLWHGISAIDLVESELISFPGMTEAGVHLQVSNDWQARWAKAPPQVWAGFLTAYASSLVTSRVLLSDIGECTRSAVAGSAECREGAEVAERTDAILEEVHAVGGGGASAASLLDFDGGLRGTLPFCDDPAFLTRGLLRADRAPKQTLRPWTRWTGRPSATRDLSNLPGPDSEERRTDPESVARAFFGEYTR